MSRLDGASQLDFYNRELSAAEIQAICAAGSVGKCKPPTLAVSLAGAHHGNGDAPPTYTLTDLKSGLATDIVTVTISVGDTSPQTNRLAAFNSRDTALLLRFRGEPGQSWRIEYRANLTSRNWTPFGTQTVGSGVSPAGAAACARTDFQL